MTLRTIASPLTIAAFAAVSVTGILMFFGYRGGLVNPVHEWGSLLFVVGAILHIIVNWKPTLAHIKRPLGGILLALFLLVTVAAVIPQDQGGGGNPVRKAVPLLLNADIPTLAALTKKTEQELISRLKASGVSVSAPHATIQQIAAAAQRNPMEVLGAILSD